MLHLDRKKEKIEEGLLWVQGVKRCPTSITIEQKDKETCKNHGKRAFGVGAGWAEKAIAP